MFNKYYQSELTYLRELGREFALAHPELADVFAAKGGDPDVERLLEGFAFLTARIRARIDDAVPELVESLGQLLLPHYVRTIPSASIVEFTPNPNALQGRHRLPAGTELGTRPIRGTSCKFRTTVDGDLLPLTVEACSLDRSGGRHPVLRLSLRTVEAGFGAIFNPQGLRLHTAGPLAQSTTLFLWLMRHLRSVTYRAGDRTIELGDGAPSAPALRDGWSLLPWPQMSLDGPRVLQEYFLLPAALLFVDLHGLHKVPAEYAAESFELLLGFDAPPPLPERVERDQLRVNCLPVVNLFETSAEPIAYDPRTHEHLLRAAGQDPLSTEVYQVHEVSGLRPNQRQRTDYTRFFDFEHARRRAQEQHYYTLRRALSPIDGGLDTYLSVMTPRDVAPALHEETLSVSLTCTNRLLPAELRTGDICEATPRSPTVARFRNIIGATPPIAPPLGSELHWRLLSHLALNQRSLGQGRNLGAMLALYCLEGGDLQQARANRMRAEAVRQVEMSLARRMIGDAVARGTATRITVDESQFAATGEVFLFGCALDALLAARVPINSFNQLELRLQPSMTELRWPPTNGTQPLI